MKYTHKTYDTGYVEQIIDGVVCRRPLTEKEKSVQAKILKRSFEQCKEVVSNK